MWLVLRGASQTDDRLLLPMKNNLSADRTGLAFRLTVDEGKGVPWVEWRGNAVETTADEAVGAIAIETDGSPDRD